MRRGDDGVGLIGSIAGITVVLAVVAFATQIAFSLYATSAISAVAYDAARVVAGSDGGDPGAAEADARDAMGTYSERVRMDWSVGTGAVVLRVRAEHPSFLPASVRRTLRVSTMDRTIRVRREAVR